MREPESSGMAVSRDPPWTQRCYQECLTVVGGVGGVREVCPRLQAYTRSPLRASRAPGVGEDASLPAGKRPHDYFVLPSDSHLGHFQFFIIKNTAVYFHNLKKYREKPRSSDCIFGS